MIYDPKINTPIIPPLKNPYQLSARRKTRRSTSLATLFKLKNSNFLKRLQARRK
ncbi:hypothetical protein Lser_V15G10076 [Lactuca serriola]